MPTRCASHERVVAPSRGIPALDLIGVRCGRAVGLVVTALAATTPPGAAIAPLLALMEDPHVGRKVGGPRRSRATAMRAAIRRVRQQARSDRERSRADAVVS